jgi:hypothetical protein
VALSGLPRCSRVLPLYSKRWVLYAKRPFGGPQQVLSYLANYTHRVALSNRRIVAVDPQHETVSFTYRDYRHGSQLKELTLSASEFIRRFSLHILPPGLWNSGQQSQKTCYRSSPRDLQTALRSAWGGRSF